MPGLVRVAESDSHPIVTATVADSRGEPVLHPRAARVLEFALKPCTPTLAIAEMREEQKHGLVRSELGQSLQVSTGPSAR